MLNRRRQSGFSLVELLVVLAILGLLASILIPNLIEALNKARQKRTMSDMKGLGIAWMAWMTDQNATASAGAAKFYDATTFTSLDYAALQNYLRPSDSFFYAQIIPQFDAWGSPLSFKMGVNGQVPINIYLCSPGRDALSQECTQNSIEVEAFLGTDYDQDIIWADGYFLRWPDGLGIAP